MPSLTKMPHPIDRKRAAFFTGVALCSTHRLSPHLNDSRGPEKCAKCRQRTEKLKGVREWMVKRGLLDGEQS
jgi:hypothetical protein